MLPGPRGPETVPGRPTVTARILAGTTSWADRSLVRDGDFYPRRTMTASERLAFYASRFDLTEIATTYRFPPTPAVSAQWVERTPAGFTFDVRAWSLLTGAPTLPDSLWPDLLPEVDPRVRDRRRLYRSHLSADGVDECWRRFAHAVRPLADADRLGVLTLQYPSWFGPRPETWEELAGLAARLPGLRLAVELRSPKWFEGDACDGTLEFLEGHDLGFVCVDGPTEGVRAVPLVVAATSDVAVVRLMGRRAVDDEPWTWPYAYPDAELDEWAPRVLALAGGTSEVHILADNCWGRDAVDAAEGLRRRAVDLGTARTAPPA